MEKKRDMAWKVLNRKIVFQDTWVQLEASSCELPDGRIIEPFYIHRDPNFAVVVAVTKDFRLPLLLNLCLLPNLLIKSPCFFRIAVLLCSI